MTPGEAIGWILIIAAAVSAGPELVSPRPVGLLIIFGLALLVAGACLVCDYRQQRTSETE